GGAVKQFYHLPEYFLPEQKSGPRTNGVFEGLSQSWDQKGIWAVNELPLLQDGPASKIYSTKSPVRFTYFDINEKKPQRQFTYSLGRLRKFPFFLYGMNGISAVLQIDENRFYVLERGFSPGYGNHGIRAMLYLADAQRATPS